VFTFEHLEPLLELVHALLEVASAAVSGFDLKGHTI